MNLFCNKKCYRLLLTTIALMITFNLLNGFILKPDQKTDGLRPMAMADTTIYGEVSNLDSSYIQASFPGGLEGWKKYLISNLVYPADAHRKNIEGRVMVTFIVDENGKLENIQAISGPDELKAEAVRVVKEGGDWTPAKQNGIIVRSERQQSIFFKLFVPEDIFTVDVKDHHNSKDVCIESSYPGGLGSWSRFLQKTLTYPKEAQEHNIQGVVIAQFIVDEQGNVSNIEAISGPHELKYEVIRVIRRSGKWLPATINGRPVKSYKKQPMTFRMEIE